MQQQLKACGDLKTSSTARSSMHHRRSSGSGATRKTSGNNNGYLATDVTTLDINTMYQSKKSKRNAAATAPSSPFQFLSGNQPPTFQFPSYMSPAAFYNNLDLLNSGELPPLMSVPAFKPNLLHGFGDTNSTAMDFAQFTEELNAIQNSSPSTLQSLFTAPDTSSAAFLSSMPKNSTASGASHNNRNSAGRKNRMVEVKTINDRPVVLVSDPQSASANSRTHMVPIRCQLMGFPKKLEESKKKPVSPEPLYSRKVFIGGLPIDVTEEEVWTTFGSFGKVLVDWPRRPEHGARADLYDNDVGRRNSRSVSGYVFLVFQNESSVQELVNACELYDGKYYLQLSSPTMSDKAVQVRAWRLADIDYFADPNALVDHRRTVFIGGVPRPTRASDLAKSLQEHYGKVSYVGIDIDPELKYPKGAARVTFSSSQSFVRAISGRFVQVTHADTNKRVEIKPYVMEDQCCDECQGKLCGHSYASYFCGDPKCLQYYCEACWDRMHYEMQDFELRTTRAEHRPMVRTGDQTRVLNRPPHHPSGNRGHQNQQNLNQNQNHSQNLMYQGNRQNHQSHQNHQDQQPQNQSIISRIVNRNHSVSPPASISSAGSTAPQTIKPFSAIPTTIGY